MQAVDPRESINEMILKDRLKTALIKLNPWLNETDVTNAVKAIGSVQFHSVMDANEQIHKLIVGQLHQTKQNIEGKKGPPKSVKYIDFVTPEENDFLVVNQMRFKGHEGNSIPNLVVFLNGLPPGSL